MCNGFHIKSLGLILSLWLALSLNLAPQTAWGQIFTDPPDLQQDDTTADPNAQSDQQDQTEQAGGASGLEDPSGAEDAGNSDQANTEPPETTPPKSRDQLRFEALKARDEAERRIEADMLLMSNIAEALSKNLGQIHYLRTLCFGRNDQKWRRYAREMMQIEAPNNSELRSQFIRAFNAGYYLEQGRHTECSAKVRVDVAALAENSRNLATMLGDPFRER